MGILEGHAMGLEGAGVIEKVGSEIVDLQAGDRVFYLGTGCLAARLKMSSTACIKIPDFLSFEQAATIPCVFVTAIHCLLDVGKLRKGESVLIHSACGGRIPLKIMSEFHRPSFVAFKVEF